MLEEDESTSHSSIEESVIFLSLSLCHSFDIPFSLSLFFIADLFSSNESLDARSYYFFYMNDTPNSFPVHTTFLLFTVCLLNSANTTLPLLLIFLSFHTTGILF